MQFPNRRVRWLLAFAVVGMFALNPLIALAQQDDSDRKVMADGAYVGYLGVKGPVSIPITVAATGEEAVKWEGSGKGQFEFVVEQGKVEGEWFEYVSDATITGRFTEGDDLVMSGPQHAELIGEGTVSGQATSPVVGPANFFLKGQVEVVTALNFTGLIPQTLRFPSTDYEEIREFTFQVEDFTASCTTFNGNWIARIEQEIAAAGLIHTLAGTFVGTRINEGDLGEGFERQIQSKIHGDADKPGLIDRGLKILNNLMVGETGISSGPSIVVWFYDATRLMHSIRKDVSCGLIDGDESKYLSPISNLAAQMFDAIRANPEMNPIGTMPIFIGAIGSGLMSDSAWVGDPANAEKIREIADNNLRSGFGSSVERGGTEEHMRNESKRYIDAAQTTGATGAETVIRDIAVSQGWVKKP